jgi:hypothetical protein
MIGNRRRIPTVVMSGSALNLGTCVSRALQDWADNGKKAPAAAAGAGVGNGPPMFTAEQIERCVQLPMRQVYTEP